MIFFPQKFKQIRESHRMTLKEIAEKIGVAESSVHSWEHGVFSPRSKNIHKLAELFRCDVEDFAAYEVSDFPERRMSINELAARGAIVPGVQLTPAEMIEAFRQAVLREIMLSDKLDPASKEAVYKIIATYQMPPVEVKP